MAGDWIKWTCGLARKREVVLIASRLHRDRHEIAGRLMSLWEWCGENIPDDDFDSESGDASLRLGDAALIFLDDILGLQGFAEILASPEIGWLSVSSDGRVVFPKLGRHNGKTSKSRAVEARKKSRQRARPAKCPDNDGTSSGPEIEIEKSNNKPPSPDGDVPPCQGETAAPPGEVRFDGKRWPKAIGPLFEALRPMLPDDVPDADLADTLRDWRQARAEKKRGKSWTPAQIDLQVAQLQQIPERERFAALRTAAVEGWQALMVRYWRERRERERQENPHIGRPARTSRSPDQIPEGFWRWLHDEHALDRAKLTLPDGRTITEDRAWQLWGEDWRIESATGQTN